MAPPNREGQLEFFDLTNQSVPQPRRDTLGRVSIQLRHDQLIVAGIGGLIVFTVVFASGVERGKQLVRSERVMLARQQAAPAQSTAADADTSSAQEGTTPSSAARQVDSKGEKSAPAPAASPKVKVLSKLAAAGTAKSGTSRYAVQVVTYSRPHLAKQELDRLQARGERAFLLIRGGRTAVYVGPFPSKGNASEKLTALKGRYQDCFVKTL